MNQWETCLPLVPPSAVVILFEVSHNRCLNLGSVRYILVFKPFPQAEKKVAELATLNNVDRLDNRIETLKERLGSVLLDHLLQSIAQAPREMHQGKRDTGLQGASCWHQSISWGIQYPAYLKYWARHINKKDNQTHGQRLHSCLKVMMPHWSAVLGQPLNYLLKA